MEFKNLKQKRLAHIGSDFQVVISTFNEALKRMTLY